ncbi:sorting nexin-10A [Lingula anatina]|uniref:Sorting nexin-10A n=1 Tax=Lingula anatina TaxID=7574 RepID=A0A1S3I5Q3_LINAN|nr:sorting nexin-10A [Lingula anatina]|eukprot:XP_013393605.1 sorting nexin-10A [Lingula anatina]
MDTTRNFTKVTVRNPVTHDQEETGKYTSYEILLETSSIAFTHPSSVVRRRYREFDWLKKQLKMNHPFHSPPSLPPKKWDKFEPHCIVDRCRGLEQFLKDCCSQTVYLSDSLFHLFLQSSLSTNEMMHVVYGKGNDRSVLDEILHSGCAFDNSHSGNPGTSSSINTECEVIVHREEDAT